MGGSKRSVLHRDQRFCADAGLPQLRRIGIGQVRARQISTLAATGFFERCPIEGEGKIRAPLAWILRGASGKVTLTSALAPGIVHGGAELYQQRRVARTLALRLRSGSTHASPGPRSVPQRLRAPITSWIKSLHLQHWGKSAKATPGARDRLACAETSPANEVSGQESTGAFSQEFLTCANAVGSSRLTWGRMSRST
jgi:hypothetical protein